MKPLSNDLQEFIRLLNAETVEYLSLLIRNKQASGRDKDLADARLLERMKP